MNDMTRINDRDAVEPISFTADEATLAGRLYRPDGDVRAMIVLHGATGVPQSFYTHFARWLVTQGYACLTYDYRDFGESLRGQMRVSKATMADWGIRDQMAAQMEAERLVPDAPIWVIGHSLGGMMLPFQPAAGRIERVICVASGPTHISDHPWRYLPMAALFWFGPAAWLTGMFSRFPGCLFRFGPDLPKGVFRQWRRWCIRRGAFMSEVGRGLPIPDWRLVRARMKFVAIADDDMVPPQVVWRLMQIYPEAIKRQLLIRPRDYGLAEVGHIDAFRRRNAVLWPALLAE